MTLNDPCIRHAVYAARIMKLRRHGPGRLRNFLAANYRMKISARDAERAWAALGPTSGIRVRSLLPPDKITSYSFGGRK